MSRFRLCAALAVMASVAGPAAAQQQQTRIQMNLSPAGQTVVKRFLSTRDPQAVALAQRATAISAQLKPVVAAPKLDLARFGALLRQQEQVQTQAMRAGNDRMLRLLGALSEADRVAFVRGMANPVLVPAQPARK